VEIVTAAGDDRSVQLWHATNNDRSLTKSQDLEAPGTRRLLSAQVTAGPRPELVCIRTKQPRLLVYEATDTKLAAQPAMELALPAASGCALADLNEDGFTDLVASRLDGSTCGIYWGDESGFSAERVQKLPGINGADACTGDFNGDGSLDIGLANEYEGNERTTFSYVYWGQDGRFSRDNRTELPTDGAKQILAGDLTGDKLTDLVAVSPIGGQIREQVPCRIYWGQPGGQFSAEYYTELEARAPYESTMADFNDDGFTDIFIANSWESQPNYDKGSYVYWGGPTGFSTGHSSVLATKGAMGSSAADFNKDGYLDLAITSFTGHDMLFWGGEDGFSDDRCISLVDPQGRVSTGGHSICADLNKDGWVDVINPHIRQPYTAIHWGGPDGFANHDLTLLPAWYASGVEVADLDSDGWLELLISGFWSNEQPDSRWRVPTLIYWGGPDGFSETRVQDLPGMGCHDISVGDLNNDGVLDIVMSSYRDQTWRSVPSYIYWGEPGGVYRWDNCSHLYNHSAAGNLIADFNQDGWLDIVFTNHTKRGNHNTLSRVWWNSPYGFHEQDITLLPTFGAHQMASTDIGNAYDRRLEETYISQPIEIAAGTVAGRLIWQADTPFGTHMKFQIRQARRLVDLKQAQWGGPVGTGTYYEQPGDLRPGISGPRWIQYRAIMCTPDGGNSSILEQVTLETAE